MGTQAEEKRLLLRRAFMWAGGILAGLWRGNRNTHGSLRGLNVCTESTKGRQLMALTPAVPWRHGVGTRLLFLPYGPSPPPLPLARCASAVI